MADQLQYIQDFLADRVPPSILSTLTTHTRTYWTIYQYALTFKSLILAFAKPFLTRLYESPDLPSVLLLLTILWASFQALNMLRRALMFWVRMTVRAAFWAVIMAVVGWAWGRGWDGAVADLQQWGSLWWGEYEKWQATQAGGKGGKTRGR